ncbi:MAG: DUF4129 domain-containing protein [Brevibacillus sp.]|nr:DUF4129 domain-containing protein [Brevibacillus sp.]
MNGRALTRVILLLSMEAQMAAGLLLALRLLPADFTDLFRFLIAASLVLGLGAWLYQRGGASLALHMLLYPLAMAVGFITFHLSQSAFLGLALAAAYYWRIHTLSGSPLEEQKPFLSRFIWTVLIYAACLFLYTLFLPGEVAPIYGMLTVSVLWFALVSTVEYVTREKPTGARTPAKRLAVLCAELAQLQFLALSGYIVCAGLVLAGLVWVWQSAKPLLYASFLAVAGPLLGVMEEWIKQLAAWAANDPQTSNLLDGGNGSDQSVPLESGPQHEALLSQLAPYLTAFVVLCFSLWFVWRVWKTRRTGDTRGTPAPSAKPDALITSLPAWQNPKGAWKEEVKAFWQRRTAPDDPVRKAYHQFLLEMAKQGLPIQKDETSQEFLLRIAATQSDDRLTALATRITRRYEQHRYSPDSLSPEDLASLKTDVAQMRKRS